MIRTRLWQRDAPARDDIAGARHLMIPTAPPPYLRTARWLAAAVALLIIWGSLYPFDLLMPNPALLAHRLKTIWSHHMSRGDMASNVLIYMPLGAAFLLALHGRGRLTHLVQATLAGSLLSLSMEAAQLFTAHRVTSVFDWLLNTAGALAGAATLTGYLLVGERWRFRSLVDPRPALVPLWLILLWIVAQFSPYTPALNAAQLHAAIENLSRPQTLSIVNWSLAIASWLVLAETMRRIWMPRFAAAALIALIAVTLFARVWIIDQELRYEEATAWVIALCSLFVSRDVHSRGRAGIAAAACSAALLIAGLWPFTFSPDAGVFHWIPFSGNLLLTRDYQPLFEKLFLYAALLWTLTLCLQNRGFAFLVAFVMTTVVELQQMWMPDRRAEITDPLLIAVLAGLFSLAKEFQPYALGTARARASEV